MPPSNDVMLGSSQTVEGEQTVETESMQIEEKDGQLVFTARPFGQPEASFVSIELTESKVIFENKEHDFPQRILYWLGPKGELHARIEGTSGGKAVHEEWVWTKAR